MFKIIQRLILLLTFFYLVESIAYHSWKKDSDFKGDDICGYTKNGITYVKPCEEGKYCKPTSYSTYICTDISNQTQLKSYGETCNSDFECEDGLLCKSKCLIDPTRTTDCPSGSEAYRSIYGWECLETAYKDYCYYKNLTLTDTAGTNWDGNVKLYYSKDPFKVCGKMNVKKKNIPSKGDVYEVESIEKSYIGSVKDGEFVLDEKACESGYALYFYGDGNLNEPCSISSPSNNYMFKKCVTPKKIDESSCIITYEVDGKELVYNVNQDTLRQRETIVDRGYFRYISIDNLNNDDLCPQNLLKKLELFKQYTQVFTKEKQDECAKNKYYDEPYTCKDDELRKWYSAYLAPEAYILYYDEEGDNNDVIKFLIQSQYPSYQSSIFLSIKYMIYLLFLLSL